MSDKLNIAPLQSWGLGDIIFCQSLANEWLDEGHKVTWGVLPQFVEGLQRAYPRVKFVDYRTLPIDYERKDEHDCNGYRVLPLRWADSICGVSYDRCMEAKFLLFNQPVSNWRKGAMWVRDEAKEREILDLMPTEPYNLINNHYQSDSKGILPIRLNNGLVDVRMLTLEGYSLFDWCAAIEQAAEIHVVSSSILYLLEILNLKMPIHLYPRPTDPKFKQVEYLFTKNYILH